MTRLLTGTRRTGSELRQWPRIRWFVAVTVAGMGGAGLGITSGLLHADAVSSGSTLTTSPGWWAYAVVAVGSGLLGLLVATYVSAPIGAEATLCDLRWPAFGVAGVLLAASPLTGASLLPRIVGAGSGPVGGISQPVLGLAAMTLLCWALVERLKRERDAINPTSPREDAACSTCRPLLPTRLAGHGHAPAEIDGINDRQKPTER